MTTLREAAQMALKLIETQNASSIFKLVPGSNLNKTVAALRTALSESEPLNQCGETCERAKLCATCARGIAEPWQEPVAWSRASFIEDDDGRAIGLDEPEVVWGKQRPDEDGWGPLYTRPVDDTALLRQCLDALETEADHPGVIDEQAVNAAITALRDRLKESA
jgi:hypothetical protein